MREVRVRIHTPIVVVLGMSACAISALADIDPSDRTADMPDSWLVLYNANNAESVTWKDWYIQQWGIPEANTLGLDVASNERVDRDHFQSQIFSPVRDHLDNNPDLKTKIMGILVGYRVPGCFYRDSTSPPLQGGGGWSTSSNLQDLEQSTWYKRASPHHFVAYWQPDSVRLSKATISDQVYITARLDAPTLADAQALTVRAKAIRESTVPLPTTDRLYYDFVDIGAPGGDHWRAMELTLGCEWLTEPAWRFPWAQFDSDSEPMPNCAMHFSYYRLTGWDSVPWDADPLGTRIVALALNSYGATTVRSTTDHNGRFVPNALVNGQFAAAMGATAEPYLGSEPHPDTIVWCLAQGWTLGEAFFWANPYLNHMWELVGDPLLTVPHWFSPGGPTVDFENPTYSAAESSGTVTVMVSLSGESDQIVTVDYASSDGSATVTDDYATAAGTMTFNPGQTSQPIDVAIVDDNEDEDDELFTLTLSSPSNGVLAGVNSPATITIIDDETAGVTVTQSDGGTGVTEGGPPDSYTLALDSQPLADVVITINPDGQIDLGRGPGTSIEVTFNPSTWDVAATITVTAVDDAADEGTHSSTLAHTAASADPGYDGISVDDLTVQIADNDHSPVTGGGGGGGGGGLPPFPPADTDGDSVEDQIDNCPSDPNEGQLDRDGDEVGDACDLCPEDPDKVEPGPCGCGVGDVDDAGLLNCEDNGGEDGFIDPAGIETDEPDGGGTEPDSAPESLPGQDPSQEPEDDSLVLAESGDGPADVASFTEPPQMAVGCGAGGATHLMMSSIGLLLAQTFRPGRKRKAGTNP